MPDSNDPGEERVAVDPRTLTSLTPETLARLRSEFGVSVELKSTKPGLSSLLDGLTKGGLTDIGLSPVAAYDRGFDRTNPGYDKYYDRDRAMMDLAAAVINPATPVVNPATPVTTPAIDASILNRLNRR